MERVHQVVLSHLDFDGQGQLLEVGCGSGALSIRAASSLTPKLFSAAGITGYRAIRPPSSHLGPMRDGFACPTPCVLDHGRPPPRPATLLRHSCADLLQGSVPTGQGIPPPKEQ